MCNSFRILLVALAVNPLTLGISAAADDRESPITIAVLPFKHQDLAEESKLVSQLLAVELSTNDKWLLVDRENIEEVFKEEELNLTGLVSSDEAIQIGRLTGAQLLITGSLLEVGGNRYLIAKLISSETTRVVGVSVKGRASDDIGELATELAEKTKLSLTQKAATLIPPPADEVDRIAQLKRKLKKSLKRKNLPTFSIAIREKHVGSPAIDPAAQTELEKTLTTLGLTVVTEQSKAGILLTGEALSEFATKRNDLIAVRGRVELKAMAGSMLLASDRQVELAIGLSEVIAGKEALQNATLTVVERTLPQIIERYWKR